MGVQLIHRSIRFYPEMALGNLCSADQAGIAQVACFGINFKCHALSEFDAFYMPEQTAGSLV
jgi:hypothetical protein